MKSLARRHRLVKITRVRTALGFPFARCGAPTAGQCAVRAVSGLSGHRTRAANSKRSSSGMRSSSKNAAALLSRCAASAHQHVCFQRTNGGRVCVMIRAYQIVDASARFAGCAMLLWFPVRTDDWTAQADHALNLFNQARQTPTIAVSRLYWCSATMTTLSRQTRTAEQAQ